MAELTIGSWRIAIHRTPPEPGEIARMYDAASLLWHPVVSLLGYPRCYRRLFRQLADDGWLEGLQEGAAVLDAGVGSGALSSALDASVSIRPHLHGIDLSPRMLVNARTRLQRGTRIDQVRLRHGSVDALPYAPESFDLVMSAHVVEHLGTPQTAVRELTRVLRAGAPLLIVTTHPNLASTLQGLRWRYRAIDPERMNDWMTAEGLRDVRCYPLPRRLCPPGLRSTAFIGRKPGQR